MHILTLRWNASQEFDLHGILFIEMICLFNPPLVPSPDDIFLNSSYLVSYDEYQEEINGEYELIFQNLGECEECVIQDLFPLEP